MAMIAVPKFNVQMLLFGAIVLKIVFMLCCFNGRTADSLLFGTLVDLALVKIAQSLTLAGIFFSVLVCRRIADNTRRLELSDTQSDKEDLIKVALFSMLTCGVLVTTSIIGNFVGTSAMYNISTIITSVVFGGVLTTGMKY